MDFSIKYTDVTTNGTITVLDGKINTSSTSLTLIGKNYPTYGTPINENFLWLLENFSNGTPPDHPTDGQLWWNSAAKIMYVRDGVNWKPMFGSQLAQPTNPSTGDIWWDQTAQQLKAYNGSSWLSVGPPSTQTGIITENILDISGVLHSVIKFTISNIVSAIFSKDPAFTVATIPGFTIIGPGLNLSTANNLGVYGVIDNSNKLGGVLAANYLRKDIDGVMTGSLTVNSNNGITVGAGNNFTIMTSPVETKLSSATTGSELGLYTTVGGVQTKGLAVSGTNGKVTLAVATTNADTLLTVATKGYVDSAVTAASNLSGVSGHILPALNNTFNIGSSANKWANVYATTFTGNVAGNVNGNSTSATNTTNVGVTNDTTAATTYYPTLSSATSGNVALRTSSSKLSFVPSTGTLTATKFAGDGSLLTNIPYSAITGSPSSPAGNVTIGSTTINLGGTSTTLAGLTSVTSTTINGARLGVTNTSATSGDGISLYNGGVAGQPTHGIMYAGTTTFGNYPNNVSSDWATYFTTDAAPFPKYSGWLFRDVTNSTNVAAINHIGRASFKDSVQCKTLGIAPNDHSAGYGINLSGGIVDGVPPNGVYHGQTVLNGSHGNVTNALATYFTSTDSPTHDTGWIFQNSTTATNVASISVTGYAAFAGNVTANTFIGVSSQSGYGDLAEKYLSDVQYEPGTVVVFGGSAEVTEATIFADPAVAGVVSTNPAYLMNKDADNSVPVALRGKVPVKVIGPVTKGDLLVCSSTPGHAHSVGRDKTYGVSIFAKALETNVAGGKKVIFAVIM